MACLDHVYGGYMIKRSNRGLFWKYVALIIHEILFVYSLRWVEFDGAICRYYNSWDDMNQGKQAKKQFIVIKVAKVDIQPSLLDRILTPTLVCRFAIMLTCPEREEYCFCVGNCLKRDECANIFAVGRNVTYSTVTRAEVPKPKELSVSKVSCTDTRVTFTNSVGQSSISPTSIAASSIVIYSAQSSCSPTASKCTSSVVAESSVSPASSGIVLFTNVSSNNLITKQDLNNQNVEEKDCKKREAEDLPVVVFVPEIEIVKKEEPTPISPISPLGIVSTNVPTEDSVLTPTNLMFKLCRCKSVSEEFKMGRVATIAETVDLESVRLKLKVSHRKKQSKSSIEGRIRRLSCPDEITAVG